MKGQISTNQEKMSFMFGFFLPQKAQNFTTDAQILQNTQSFTADYFVCSLRSGHKFFKSYNRKGFEI